MIPYIYLLRLRTVSRIYLFMFSNVKEIGSIKCANIKQWLCYDFELPSHHLRISRSHIVFYRSSLPAPPSFAIMQSDVYRRTYAAVLRGEN